VDLYVKKLTGEEHSKINVSDSVFYQDYNKALIHQVTVAYIASSHTGSKAQKTRSEVSGSGAKPWKQKGTGRARAGTIRSPLFRGGGVTFAAKPMQYKNNQKVNRKMYRGAVKSILSELIRRNRLIVISNIFELSTPSTRILIKQLYEFNIKKNSLVIVTTKEFSKELYLASRNIKDISFCTSKSISPVSLMRFHKIFITQNAIREIEGQLS